MSIELKNVCFSYGERPILKDISFTVNSGDLIAVLGPNGVGKSTLFSCILGQKHPSSGSIEISGKPISHYDKSSLAKEVAYIPQSASPVFSYTVLESVLMGMTNRLRLFEAPDKSLEDEAFEALESLGIADLSGRACTQISGGERQLMLLARALVQQAKVLIMDEPTANLDYGNSFRVMQRIMDLGEKGYSVIFSTHEPNQAFRYANRVIALQDGRILADGAPNMVLSEKTLGKMYRIGVAVRSADVYGESYSLSIPYEKK